MALALCILGVGAHSLRAATRVETDKTVTITALVDLNDGSKFASDYNGKVEIELYKVASLDESGNPKLTSNFANSGIDLTVLQNKPTVDDVKTAIVDKAIPVSESLEADKVITLDREQQQTSASVSIEAGAGIYLYIPQPAEDDRYKYEFTPYVIYAPGSEYIASGQGSDEWNYDVSFRLKSSEERRYGTLVIRKVLDNYNIDLGTASFVYKIKAKLAEGTVVFDDVRTLDFKRPETQELRIELPSTAIVTITEANTGASYKVVGVATESDIEITGETTTTVEFENEYDDTKLISGDISAVNTFEKIDGEYVGHRTDSDERAR